MADRLHVRHGSVFAYVHEPRERRAAGETEGNRRERGSTRISRSSRNRARRPPQARLIYEWDQTPEEVDGADWPSSVPLWCSDRPIVRWSLLSSFRLSLSFSSSLSLSLFLPLFSASLSLARLFLLCFPISIPLMPPPAPSSASSFSPAPRLCLLVAEDAIRPSSLPVFYPHGIRGIYLLGQLCVGGIVGRIIGSKLGDLLMSASSSSLPRCHVSLSGNILLTVSCIA